MIRSHVVSRAIVATFALLALTFAAAGHARAQSLVAPQPALARGAIDAAVQRYITRKDANGISIAVLRDGKQLYAHGYGVRNAAELTTVDPQAYFGVGAITNAFTATAIALLESDGKVHSNDRVAVYLPDVPHASEITVGNLIHQTSGLADYTNELGFIDLLDAGAATPAQLYGLVAGKRLAFVPGSRYADSTTNYLILGAIVEKTAGMPFAAFLRTRVLRDTPFAGISYGEPVDKAISLAYDSAAGDQALRPWPAYATAGAGALFATPTEIVRWDEAFFSGQVVAPALVLGMTQAPVNRAGARAAYASGWVDGELDGKREVWHDGRVRGFSAFNAYFPDQHVAIAIETNNGSLDPQPIARDVFRAIVSR